MDLEVLTTQKLSLNVYQAPFEIGFAWNRKRGVEKDFWFTPSGKCKFYIGAFHINLVGKVEKAVYSDLVKRLKLSKTNLLNSGSNFYTVTNDDSVSQINNMASLLYSATKEWDERKYVKSCVEDDRVYEK